MDPEQARAVVWPGMRRMLGGSAFILGCRLAGAALTFLTQILLARWMGASEFGIYVIAFSWCLLLATVTALGLPMAAIRFIGMGLAQGRGDYIRGFVDWGSRVTVIASAVVAIAGIALIWQLPLSGGFQPALTMALVALPGLSLLFFNGGVANSCSRLTLGFLPTNVLRPVAFFVLVGLFWWPCCCSCLPSSSSVRGLLLWCAATSRSRRLRRLGNFTVESGCAPRSRCSR
jgi:O-antigen/teichoic acid export membrane protein